jgi:hypothetical protein
MQRAVEVLQSRKGSGNPKRIHMRNGVYPMSTTLRLFNDMDKLWITGESKGGVIWRCTTTNVDFRMLKSIGALESDPGRVITDNYCINITWDGAHISNKTVDVKAFINHVVDGCIFERHHAPRPGVVYAHCDGAIVKNCIIRQQSGDGGDWHWDGYRFVFANNEGFRDPSLDGKVTSGAGGCVAASGLQDALIVDNWIHNWSGNGCFTFEVQQRQNLRITYERNLMENCNAPGIRQNSYESFGTHSDFDTVVIKNNTFRNLSGPAIRLGSDTPPDEDGIQRHNHYWRNIKIFGNTVDRCDALFRGGPLRNVEIYGNNCTNNRGSYKIWLFSRPDRDFDDTSLGHPFNAPGRFLQMG